MDATAARPSSEIDLFSDESLADPYPIYRELRQTGPAVYLERHDIWAITRFGGVREVLRDWQRFTSTDGVALNEPTNLALTGAVLTSDPPEHTALRRVLSDQLAPGAMKRLNLQIAEQADELVASLVAQGEFDAVLDLAAVFPISVVADLIGLPPEGRENLLAWGNAIFDGFGPENDRTTEALPLIEEMYAYLAAVATRDRLMPGSMGLSVYEAADRGEIDAESCVPLMGAYVAAGMDTTINAIGTAIHLFALQPEQWQALRRDPSLVGSAGNEVLRYDAPVQAFSRVTTDDQVVEGQHIPKGDRIWVLYGSANRDDSRWPDAEVFDVSRNAIDHLSFGHGIHRCAGAALARVEIESVLSSLASRVKAIEVTGPVHRRLNNTVRGLKSLPVSVSAA